VEVEMAKDKSIMKVEGVSKKFLIGLKTVDAIGDIGFDVREGEFMCIVGPSGCGKSTLLRIISGLIPSTSGKVVFEGKTVQNPTNKVTMVFQSFALYPWKKVLDNVRFGLDTKGMPREKQLELSRKYLDLVGLSGFEDAYPKHLSGGMKQRVGFARALVVNPKVVLLDEPLSALDEITAEGMRKELVKLWQETKKTIVMVTHNIPEAVEIADRIVVLSGAPSKVKKIIDVKPKRPRKHGTKEFNRYVKMVHEALGS
jgi:NitT/TauT family transport system ATP-binding protein